MKYIKMISVLCCVFMFVQISFASEKIGVIDIQKIVNNSSQVQMLKQEHQAQIQSLNQIITEAQNAIAQEKDPQKIIILQDKYNNEFNTKKDAIDKQYSSRLSTIEAKLKQEIYESAKKHDYDYVFAKSVVFYGGDDITDLISKDIK